MNKKIILLGVGLLLIILSIGFVFIKGNVINTEEFETENDEDDVKIQTQDSNSQVPITASNGKQYSLADIATHKDSSSCWSAINGKVYDLTSWIGQHPGGDKRILGICGIDGSSQFDGQHAGEGKPESYLSSFYIGELK